LSNWNGKKNIICIPKDTIIPEKLVLLHEFGDHYSLQTTEICTKEELEDRMNKFISKFKPIKEEDYYNNYEYANN
jgi:hypothetical protein